MTYKEMYDHLADDLKRVKYREEYYLPKAIKEFRKARKFPAWKWYEYIVPKSKNKYVIFFYAENVSRIETPKVDFFVDLFFNKQRFVVKWGAGGYRHTPNTPIKAIRQLHAYTSHFLHKYNKRFLKDEALSANDIACRYLSRNNIAIPIEINENINANIENYGDGARQGFRVKDGLCFTRTGIEGDLNEEGCRDGDRVDAMAIVYTTFMPESQMADGQRLAIEKEHWEKWTASFIDFLKEAKDGTITLKLDP